MTKIWPIAVNAFVQTIRQPIFSYLVLLFIGIQILVTASTGYSMQTDLVEGDIKLMTDASLATLMAYAVFMAIVSASTVLSKEIESRTVLTVVAKPVSRFSILIGKFLGVSFAVTVGFYLASIALILNVQHGVVSSASTQLNWVVIISGASAVALSFVIVIVCNFFFNFNASTTFTLSLSVLFAIAFVVAGFYDRSGEIASGFYGEINFQVFIAIALIWMAAIIMTALAVSVSTRLNMVSTMIVCVAVYFLSMITDEVFRPYIETNMLAKACWWVLPNLTYFFVVDNLTVGQSIGGGYVLWAAGYGLCYTTALIFGGLALFQTREMDGRADGSSAPMLVNFYAWGMRIVAALAVITAMAMVSTVGAKQFLAIGVLLVCGLLVWFVAGGFGRGIRWTLWLIVLFSVVQLGLSIAVFVSQKYTYLSGPQKYALIATAICNSLFVFVMLMRKSTKMFFSANK